MKSLRGAILALALPAALPAQTVAAGAGGAILTTTKTLAGEPGGGAAGVAGQVELLTSGRAGGRVDVTLFEAAVFAGLNGTWHFRDAHGVLDPYAFAGVTLQFPRHDGGDSPGGGLAAGIGTNLRPARSPIGVSLELRLYQLFRNAYDFDPERLVQLGLGLRLTRR